MSCKCRLSLSLLLFGITATFSGWLLFQRNSVLEIQLRHETSLEQQLVTVMVSLSPIPSMPDTSTLEITLESLKLVPGLDSNILLIFDGSPSADRVNGSRARSYDKFWKDEQIADAAYDEYKKRVKDLCSARFPGAKLFSMDKKACLWRGLKTGMELHVKTKFVLIMQFDRPFIKSFDLRALLRIMEANSSQVKYVFFTDHANHPISGGCQAACLNYHSNTVVGGVALTKDNKWVDSQNLASVAYYTEFVWPEVEKQGARCFQEEVMCGYTRKRNCSEEAWTEVGSFLYGGFNDGCYTSHLGSHHKNWADSHSICSALLDPCQFKNTVLGGISCDRWKNGKIIVIACVCIAFMICSISMAIIRTGAN